MRQLQEFQEDRMVRKSVKITVCTMAAVMAFSGMNITANAAASSSTAQRRYRADPGKGQQAGEPFHRYQQHETD